jgi:hypothetical protein
MQGNPHEKHRFKVHMSQRKAPALAKIIFSLFLFVLLYIVHHRALISLTLKPWPSLNLVSPSFCLFFMACCFFLIQCIVMVLLSLSLLFFSLFFFRDMWIYLAPKEGGENIFLDFASFVHENACESRSVFL